MRATGLHSRSTLDCRPSAGGASPACAQAARTVFASRHAIVRGPTPPGTGVRWPATSRASPNSRLPLSTKTAPDPSYPGAHSAISKAGATVLGFYFGDQFTFDVTSESLAGVTRHFTSFSAAAEEAGLSRIYAGQHFRTDHIAGKTLGKQVAQSIDSSILRRGE